MAWRGACLTDRWPAPRLFCWGGEALSVRRGAPGGGGTSDLAAPYFDSLELTLVGDRAETMGKAEQRQAKLTFEALASRSLAKGPPPGLFAWTVFIVEAGGLCRL
ncbi:hypothetical protein NDU88_002262 [Pleurodeles waltl]|uniref:Uncharacterized protein n=1 Tax=Pleurodeles waltl TaxID=8319 RepID=A0AAV7VBZ8_PLEWA|nr:hypothetical protein NDU88_002262 [Pleurodeles waltl]